MKKTILPFAMFLAGCAAPALTPQQFASCEIEAGIVHQGTPERSEAQHMEICRKQILGR